LSTYELPVIKLAPWATEFEATMRFASARISPARCKADLPRSSTCAAGWSSPTTLWVVRSCDTSVWFRSGAQIAGREKISETRWGTQKIGTLAEHCGVSLMFAIVRRW